MCGVDEMAVCVRDLLTAVDGLHASSLVDAAVMLLSMLLPCALIHCLAKAVGSQADRVQCPQVSG